MNTSPALLIVECSPRYWEDSVFNNIRDDAEGTLAPFRDGSMWKPIIELATGKICDWPEGTRAEIHYKVCDEGEYWLANEQGEKLYTWRGSYVPDAVLCPKCSGHGDYIIFDVGADGQIAGWNAFVDMASWREVYTEAKP